jgi:hypothetical protein
MDHFERHWAITGKIEVDISSGLVQMRWNNISISHMIKSNCTKS